MKRLAFAGMALIGVFAALGALADNGRARINPNPGFLIGRSGGGRAGRLTISGTAAVPITDAGTPFAFNFAQTGAACQCVDVTGLKGEAINFSRASVAYCTKGNETTGILNGDIVECASNKPRIMPGLDGTGGLGLAVWDSRRNGLLFSQQFDNAAWTKESSCTVTPDVAIAPDGTLSADLMTCPGSGDIYQFACPVNFVVRSVYARAPYTADGGSQTISDFTVCGSTCSGSPTVTLSSDYWVRVINDNQGDVSGYIIMLKASAGSVLLWQADCQDNTSKAAHPLPPPIKTTTVAVTRPAEIAPLPVFVPMRTSLTVSASYVPESFPDDGYTVDLGLHSGVDGFAARVVTSALTCENEIGASHTDVIGTTVTSAGAALSCTYDGTSTLQACVGAACVDAGVVLPPTTIELTLGSHWNGVIQTGFLNGVLKNVSVTEPALKNIFLFGDSIVEGNTAGSPWHPQEIIHNIKGNTVAIQNDGHSAWTIDQCKTQWDSDLAWVVAGGQAARTHFMVQCGINSQLDDGGTSGGVANVVAKLESMIASGRDAGIHVLWSTITPACGTGAEVAFIDSTNSQLRAYCTSTGTPYAETFRGLEFPADSGCLNPAYTIGDNVHLNDAGTVVETLDWIQAGGW